MNNKMSEVAKLLGVELGEEFNIVGVSGTFKLANDGLVKEGVGICYASILFNLLKGELQINKKWKPRQGEFFYYLDFSQPNGYNGGNYEPHIDKGDGHRVDWGFITKTKEEIIIIRDKVLETMNRERI